MYGQIICKNLMSDQKEDLIEHITVCPVDEEQ